MSLQTGIIFQSSVQILGFFDTIRNVQFAGPVEGIRTFVNGQVRISGQLGKPNGSVVWQNQFWHVTLLENKNIVLFK